MKIIGEPNIKYYVVHHSAVSRAAQPLQRDAINSYHKNKWGSLSSLGWYGGYNLYTEPTGERTQFRAIGEETIAQVGYNCDVPSRCTAISHCFGGDFRVEKPTIHQVEDLRRGYLDAKELWPDIKLVQHKDLQGGRTCAALESSYLLSLIEPDDELERLRRENEQLRGMVTQLIRVIQKNYV